MYRKKYRAGDYINNLAEVDQILDNYQYLMMWCGNSGWVPKHPGIIGSMTIYTIKGMIKHKRLAFAVKN